MAGYGGDDTIQPEFDEIAEIINSITPEKAAPLPDSPYEGGFMTVSAEKNYAKSLYYPRPNVLEVNGEGYAVSQEKYDRLKALAAGLTKDGGGMQWCIYMNPNRIVQAEASDEKGDMQKLLAGNTALAAILLRDLSVQSGKSYKPGANSFDGAFQAFFTFDSGAVYTLAVKDGKLYLEASDMSYACEYEVHETALKLFRENLRNMIYVQANPPTGKPVIYLYPEKTREVSVKLSFNGTVTYTYPAYNGGWEVIAEPGGRLTNKADTCGF
ncbi:hypothetical protein FACS1894191_2600 [Clostridia bacterium]|nr:hypothetical protein FACS1894191_2600 [Clostridia bacterium]